MDKLNVSDFNESTVDKVYRLLELLEEIERHPLLRGKFALHGGTAINLFMLDVPRLSVDIDISYIGALGREEMLKERPALEEGIREVGRALGYEIPPSSLEHAGTTFLLRYRGPRRNDHVKIDTVYLNRMLLLDPVMRTATLGNKPSVRVFSDAELVGSKVKAFFDRVKVRDLYDVANLYHFLEADWLAAPSEQQMLHEVVLYYAALSARFPFGFEGREERFAGCKEEVVNELYPMLRSSIDSLSLEQMMGDASAFVEEWVIPRTENERAFLDKLETGTYSPELLFTNVDMAERAAKSPQAQWKVANLKKRK